MQCDFFHGNDFISGFLFCPERKALSHGIEENRAKSEVDSQPQVEIAGAGVGGVMRFIIIPAAQNRRIGPLDG